MTCSDFKELSENDTAFENLTTAERVAMAKHFHGCFACRGWFLAMEEDLRAERPLTDEEGLENDRIAAECLLKDLSDPEAL